MGSRNLADADPTLATLVKALQEEFFRRYCPHELVVTYVARTREEHEALWAQGRRPLVIVNAYRARAGMAPITEKANVEVTWTTDSKHLRIPSLAVDLAVAVDPDGAEGPMKPVIEWEDEPRYHQMGAIAIDLGLRWGGSWKKPDLCHVELPEVA